MKPKSLKKTREEAQLLDAGEPSVFATYFPSTEAEMAKQLPMSNTEVLPIHESINPLSNLEHSNLQNTQDHVEHVSDLKSHDSVAHTQPPVEAKPLTVHAEPVETTPENLENLFKSLENLYNEKPLDPDLLLNLRPLEKTFFLILVFRCLGILVQEELPMSKLVEVINDNLEKCRSKRLEEDLRMVYKKTIKHLLNKVKAQMVQVAPHQQSIKREAAVLELYKQYFAPLLASNGMLRDRYKIHDEKGQVNYQKLYNSLILPSNIIPRHIWNISLSSKYKQEVEAYLEDGFVKDYQNGRTSKIKKLLRSFYDCVVHNPSKEALNDLLDNHQVKVPWSNKELEKAKQHFKEVLKNSISNYMTKT